MSGMTLREVVTVAAIIVILGFVGVGLVDAMACSEAGGVAVRGLLGFECLQQQP